MWIVHAGNRTDADDRRPARFPATNVDHVERRLRRLLEEMQPSGVVGAAAAGADLLLLDAARALGVPIEVVLPLPVEEFIERSVADRGDAWVARFRRILPDPSVIHVVDLSDLDDWYLRGNDLILDRALAVAGDEGVLALAVRPAPSGGPESATDDFVRRAESRQLTVIDIDPARTHGATAVAVVPHGRQPDPSRPGVSIDFEITFRTMIVPLLEDADLDWTRADLTVEAGMGHVGMFDDLANADVVVADLTLEIPKVLYALGIRHARRPRSTVVLNRHGALSTSDLRTDRQLHYDLAGAAMTDAEALAAIRRIRPAIADAMSDTQQVAGGDPEPSPETTG